MSQLTNDFNTQITDTAIMPNAAFFMSPETMQTTLQEKEKLLADIYESAFQQDAHSFDELIRYAQNIVANLAEKAKKTKRTDLNQTSESDCMKVYRLLDKALDAFNQL